MASFEAGINQYLHPPIELKQANIKAEMIHIGTIVEAILKIFIDSMINRNLLTTENVIRFARRYPNQITFKQLIDVVNAYTDIDYELIKKLHEIRTERNKIHIDAIEPPEYGELDYEEFRAIEFRNKLDFLLEEVRRVLT